MLSVSSIFSAIAKMGITIKKCHTKLDCVNSDVTISNRMAYDVDFIEHALEDMEKCIFIDESGFSLHLYRSMARSKKDRERK